MNKSFSASETLASWFPEECRIAHLENNDFIYGGGPALNWKPPEYILPKYQINTSTTLNKYQDPTKKKFSPNLKNFSSHPDSIRFNSKSENNPMISSNPLKSLEKSNLLSKSRTSSVPVRKLTEEPGAKSIISQKFSDFADKISDENISLGLEESLRIKTSGQETLGRTRTSNTSNHSHDSLGLNSIQNMQDRFSNFSKASQDERLSHLNSSLKLNHSSLLNHSEAKERLDELNHSKKSNRISDSNQSASENKRNIKENMIFSVSDHSKTANLVESTRSRRKSVINSASSPENILNFDVESRKIPISAKNNSNHHSKRSKSSLGSIDKIEKAVLLNETKYSTTKNNPIFQNSLKKSNKSEESIKNLSIPRNSSEFFQKDRESSLKSKKSLQSSNPENSKNHSQNSSSCSLSQSSKSNSNVHSKQTLNSKNPAFTPYSPSTYYESLGLNSPNPYPNYSRRSLKRKKSDTHHFKQTFNSKLRSSVNESYTYS